MSRYIIRRVLHMIPTVFGVIVITFILFNIAGGSPASMTLGKNVSPKLLEEFDEQRGFNKPLFCGFWAGTRTYQDTFFERNAGPWQDIENIRYVAPSNSQPGHIVLSPGRNYTAPLAFKLNPNTTYRWIMSYRLTQGTAWAAPVTENQAAKQVSIINTRGSIPRSPHWKTIRLTFNTGADPEPIVFRSEEGPLEIRSLKLKRKGSHFFDSQFMFYLGQIARFNFGTSTYSNQKVSRMLKDGILPSLSLTIPIFIVGLVVSISISLICAFFRNTWLDRSIVVTAVSMMSLNYLVWIVAGQYVLGYKAGWFPIWGFESWRYLLLPVIIGTISGLGNNVRFYRTIMLDEMYMDYVRTAFAKGVSRTGVLFKHVLKNAMIPILTNMVIAVPFLYTGSLLLEKFFGIPGLGRISIDAINTSDVDVVRSVVFIGAVLYVIANLLTDICYAMVDPRVKLK